MKWPDFSLVCSTDALMASLFDSNDEKGKHLTEIWQTYIRAVALLDRVLGACRKTPCQN